MTLESCDADSSDHDEGAGRAQDAANPFKASGAGGIMSMIQRSLTSLTVGFKHCSKEKGKVFAASGAIVG